MKQEQAQYRQHITATIGDYTITGPISSIMEEGCGLRIGDTMIRVPWDDVEPASVQVSDVIPESERVESPFDDTEPFVEGGVYRLVKNHSRYMDNMTVGKLYKWCRKTLHL